jgi:serine/threonine protein kinase
LGLFRAMFVCPECGASQEAPGFCTEDGAQCVDGSTDRLLGQLVGRYRVARMIGKGGMGEVFLGVQPEIGSRVAIKVLPPERAENKTLVDRFFAEARAVNLIRHEGIVNVLDLSTLPDGRPYIVMEFLEGAPLSSFIEHGALALGTLANLAIDVAGALTAAHERGIVHRDLKPDNVYVTAAGRPKVLDFGIAKLRPELGAQEVATQTGALLGTPHYMSPEQALGRAVDHRADIYSLGVILFEAATGRRPFEADSLFELLRHHVDTQPPSPLAARPEMPPAYADVILRALAKDPAARFQSADELARALHEAARALDESAYVSLSRYASLPPSGAQHTPRFSSPSVTQQSPRHSSTVGPGVAPTAPGLGTTIGDATVASSASNFRLWPILLGLAVVVLGGSAFVVFVFVLGQRGLAISDSQAPVPGAPPPGASGLPAAPGDSMSMRYRTTAGGWNQKRLAVDPSFSIGKKESKHYFADAEVASFMAVGVTQDGNVDLTVSGNSVSMTLRSPAASVGKRLGSCTVSISMAGEYLTSAVLNSAPCYQTIIGPPKCSVAQVFEKARKAGFKHDGPVSLTYTQYSSSPAWQVQVKGGVGQMVPDDC